MRIITVLAHAGVVTGLAGLFFGVLAWVYNSPFGLSMALGSLILLCISGAAGRFYGFSPLWRSYGWEDTVTFAQTAYIVSTQQYPPYLARQKRKEGSMRYGSAVYQIPVVGEDLPEDSEARFGMQWREHDEARQGHQWLVNVIGQGRFSELEPFKPIPEHLTR